MWLSFFVINIWTSLLFSFEPLCYFRNRKNPFFHKIYRYRCKVSNYHGNILKDKHVLLENTLAQMGLMQMTWSKCYTFFNSLWHILFLSLSELFCFPFYNKKCSVEVVARNEYKKETKVWPGSYLTTALAQTFLFPAICSFLCLHCWFPYFFLYALLLLSVYSFGAPRSSRCLYSNSEWSWHLQCSFFYRWTDTSGETGLQKQPTFRGNFGVGYRGKSPMVFIACFNYFWTCWDT